ncbi:RIB43A-like with coiled-coils protein 2 [Nilaparvata lugens]|uniref:RIB43A-like with coiled-coils protein 2 n=1 Tax=Nilaparvata lugens TaxID=108931 RepID=UPI00193E7919|nr:RIB43A-like with coiled-coils protein 2 [Nilaparvata lugens]
MLGMKFSTPQDLKEMAKIEKKRKMEEERKARIFNPRNRLIGVDVSALENQIAEKKTNEEMERAREEAFRLKQERDTMIATQLARQIEEKKHNLNKELNEFRKHYQRKEDRIEFDLYDPDLLKKSLPCRVSDDDPRLSVSGAQNFIYGNNSNRLGLLLFKLISNANELFLNKSKTTTATFRLKNGSATNDRPTGKEQNFLGIAAEQETQKRMRELRDMENEQCEMYNAVTGDLLSECCSTQSNLGPNRTLVTAFKGMSQQMRDQIRAEQLKQIEERKARREEEEKIEKAWAEQMLNASQVVSQRTTEMMMKQRELNRQMLELNKKLSQEQRMKKEYSDKVIYTNRPTEEYFNQFNTCTR